MGVAMDNCNTTMGFTLRNGWNQLVFPISINPFRCVNKDNVTQALALSLDLWRNIWCLGARKTISAGSIKQIITLFQCDGWPRLRQQVLLSSAATLLQALLNGTHRCQKDLQLLWTVDLKLPFQTLLDSQLILHQVDTKDFLSWNQNDKGLLIHKPSNLLASGTETKVLGQPAN